MCRFGITLPGPSAASAAAQFRLAAPPEAGPRCGRQEKGRAAWHPGTRRRRWSPQRGDGAAEHRLKPTLCWPHLDRSGRRRDRRHRHPDPDRRRRRQGRAGGDPLLRHRRPDLRRRGARLCRNGDDDPGLGQRLYLHLCRARRVARLDRRLEPDPRIFAGGERGGGGLVGLCVGLLRGHRLGASRGVHGRGPSSAASSTCPPSSSSRSSPACSSTAPARARRSTPSSSR